MSGLVWRQFDASLPYNSIPLGHAERARSHKIARSIFRFPPFRFPRPSDGAAVFLELQWDIGSCGVLIIEYRCAKHCSVAVFIIMAWRPAFYGLLPTPLGRDLRYGFILR